MEKKKIIRSASGVSFFIMLSRVGGLVRDMAMAAFFGSSLAMDAFVVAFTIPNLFRSLFGEGALSSAFVPVFTETLQKKSRAEVWQFTAKMFSFLGATLAALVAAGILLASLGLVFLRASPRLELILELLRIMLPYTFFICLTAFFAAMLNALRRFMLPAAAPVVMNLTLIAALFLVCPLLPAEGYRRITVVAWSVIAAGIFQSVMLFPTLAREGFRLSFVLDFQDPRVRRVGQLLLAAIIGVGVTQVNVLLNRLVAMLIGQGAPSYLYYAERLIYFPLGIFATALGTILLPTFSSFAAQARPDLLRETLNHSLRQLLFVMLPAAAGLLALTAPIVRLIYQRGDFSAQATQMTALAVQCYAPGLVVFSLLKVLIPVFYAQQDMKTPVKIGLLSTALNVALMLILMWPLKHAGIALASVISAGVQVVIMVFIVQRRLGTLDWPVIFNATLRMAVAATIMVLAARGVYYYIQQASWLIARSGLLQQLVPLVLSILAAILVYGAAAAACRCPELREFSAALRRKKVER